MNKRTQEIIDFYAHEYRDMKQSKDDLEDMLTGFIEAIECEHECSSNCRREGCNCACGNSHFSGL